MSLEKDVSGLQEAGIFKGATPDELTKRREERLKALGDKPVIPVDPIAMKIDGKRWELTSKLENRLRTLRHEHTVDDRCICDEDVLELHGLAREYTEIPGENGYTDAFCLRCGGTLELW